MDKPRRFLPMHPDPRKERRVSRVEEEIRPKPHELIHLARALLQVNAENLLARHSIRPLHENVPVEAPFATDCRIQETRSVRRENDERARFLDTVHLDEELRND